MSESRESPREEGLLDKIRGLVNSKVSSGKFPTSETLGYESSMGIYGGTLVEEDSKLLFDVRGFWNRIDQWGDRFLRSYDDHHARDPVKMARQHPRSFLKMLPFVVDSKRYRGTPEQALIGSDSDVPRVEQMGLDWMYAVHPKGIEIKEPELFKNSIGLQDIFRADTIGNPQLLTIDRFDALGKAANYLWKLHQRLQGGIAEGNVYSFLFSKNDGPSVEEPYLMVPTQIYNPEKHISRIEQKATDLLDLLGSVSFEEFRRSNSWESVDRAIDVVLASYQDSEVIAMVESYIKRGRLTLPNDVQGLQFETTTAYRTMRHVTAMHNTQRLSADSEQSSTLRHHVQQRCEEYLGRNRR